MDLAVPLIAAALFLFLTWTHPASRSTRKKRALVPAHVESLPDPPRINSYPVSCPRCRARITEMEMDTLRRRGDNCRAGPVRYCPMHPAYLKRQNG